MARDYKHHGRGRRSALAKQPVLAAWRWALITGLIIAFAVALYALTVHYQSAAPDVEPVAAPVVTKPEPKAEPQPAAKPEFEFFTILPGQEVVVPEQEMKARIREEKHQLPEPARTVGSYTIQAGSFREPARAERLKAELALLGVESHIEKAKVGEVFWHRVKIGPFQQARQVGVVMQRLKEHDIKAKVTENAG
ncbi:MAG: SPOR domain-containing protein [Methylococcales bacterium]|nr:SPOR domain-containing protein [Methylococcales bacterium]